MRIRRCAVPHLELIGSSDDGDPHLLLPFAQCATRGYADEAVRLAVARELPRYDPRRHRRLFELALYDPHPQIAEQARKLTAHQGYHLLRPHWC